MDDQHIENELGIHYVRGRESSKPKVRAETCRGCGAPATCVGRLYVPCSKLSPNRNADDVSVLLCGLFWCDRHFFGLNPQEFVTGERGEQIRDAVIREFRQRNAFPNFEKACIGRIPASEPDFERAQLAVDIARRP